jgi:hypothetical protein
MAIRTYSLKFKIGTGDNLQLPQTNGDGFHSLLPEVVSDVGNNFQNAVLLFFHCARFCPLNLLLRSAQQEKLTGYEICTS